MSEKRVSHVVGKGSLSHNNRCFFAKNVDTSRTPQNIEIVRIPLAKAYDDLFSEAVERYNDKQTRKCRRIDTDYFFHLFNHKVCDYTLVANNKQKSFYEDLVQVGDMHDTGCGTPDAEIAKQCLIEYAEHYIKNNSNFYVFNAVIHMDEATPHLHINYIPVGHYSKGLDTRNAMAKALEEMGYTGVNAATKWREHERAVFTEICKSHSLEIAAPLKSRGYNFTVDEYKDIQEEKKRLTEELKPLREMELAADENTVVGKKQLLSHNITVTPEELQQLETQKKAVAVQTLDNQNKLKDISDRENALDEREAEIAAKEAESTQLSIERSASLDRRESEIEKTNRQSVFLMNKAENQMRLATARYNEQVELNHRYSELNDKFRKLDREYAECSHTLSEIRQAVGIAYSDDEIDTLDRCREIVDENYQIKNCIAKELHLSYKQKTSIKLPDMLKMLIDNFKDKLKEQEEDKSVIASLREQLSTVKEEFKKVAYAVNELVYSSKYKAGLSGWAKALAESISLFAINCLDKRGEYDDLYNGTELDAEISQRAIHFKEQQKSEQSRYVR